jgi:hypothetical protein
MHQISEKFVPRLLTDDQNYNDFPSVKISTKEQITTEIFFKNVVTSDETLVYGYDFQSKQQSSQWKSSASPHPKKAQEVCL